MGARQYGRAPSCTQPPPTLTLSELRKRRRIVLSAFALVSIFIFSGFVYGPSGNGRTAFSLEGDSTWEAAMRAETEMPSEYRDVYLFVGPAWEEKGGNILTPSVMREIVLRYDEMMSNEEITEHLATTFSWETQTEVTGPWAFANTVRAVMNNQTPVTQQIGWTGSTFENATDAEINDVLGRLFSIEMVDGSHPYAALVSGLERDDEGKWTGRASFISGYANASSLLGPNGEYSATPGDTKPFFEEWELMIDEIYSRPMTDTGEEVHVWSYLAIDSEINEEVAQTMPLIGVSFTLMVIILGLFFRDWRDVAAASAGLGLMMGWMFGTQAWLGYPQTQVSSMLPILLLALGVDFSFHGLHRWRAIASGNGGDEKARLAASWESITSLRPALGLATLTTMIAFGTAAFSPIPDLAEWGVLAVIFIFEAYLLLGIFTVVLRSGNKVKSGDPQEKFANNMRKLAGTQVRRPIPFIIVLLMLTSGALFIGQPDTDFNAKDYVDNDSRMMQSLEVTELAFDIEDKGEPGYILVEGNGIDLAEYETLQGIQLFMSHMDENNWTHGKATIVDMLVWQGSLVMSGGPGFTSHSIVNETGLPSHASDIRLMLLDIIANGTMDPSDSRSQVSASGASELAKVNSETGELEMLILPMKVGIAHDWQWMEEYKALVEELMESDMALYGGQEATLTGQSFQRYVYVNAMTSSFQNSIYIAVVACFAVLLIVFRDIRLSVLTISPVIAVSLWLYAGMNLAGTSLNLVTLQVASLAIGLGLDYAIHVTQAIREQKERRPDEGMERWTEGMMGHTGSALIASGFTDIVGFGVLLLSVMPMFSMFGKVMIAMVILAQAACVFILPALLTKFGGLEKTNFPTEG